jgi:hypothetical protein
MAEVLRGEALGQLEGTEHDRPEPLEPVPPTMKPVVAG